MKLPNNSPVSCSCLLTFSLLGQIWKNLAQTSHRNTHVSVPSRKLHASETKQWFWQWSHSPSPVPERAEQAKGFQGSPASLCFVLHIPPYPETKESFYEKPKNIVIKHFSFGYNCYGKAMKQYIRCQRWWWKCRWPTPNKILVVSEHFSTIPVDVARNHVAQFVIIEFVDDGVMLPCIQGFHMSPEIWYTLRTVFTHHHRLELPGFKQDMSKWWV